VRLEGLGKLKNPLNSLGIKPATLQLVSFYQYGHHQVFKKLLLETTAFPSMNKIANYIRVISCTRRVRGIAQR
jgi:hypothetical protein